MKKKGRNISGENSVNFFSAINNYNDAIEEIFNAVEDKKDKHDDNIIIYSLSLQILKQITQQMKSLKEHRLSFASGEQKLIFHPDLHYFFEKFKSTNGVYDEKTESTDLSKEEEFLHQKTKTFEGPINNAVAPPPWKPNK